jgi:filamentous hemagglutinin family protein
MPGFWKRNDHDEVHTSPLLRSVAFAVAEACLPRLSARRRPTCRAAAPSYRRAGHHTKPLPPAQLTITQSSAKAVIDWTSFQRRSEQCAVQFIQPDAASITLNRVTGGQQSRIAGNVTANGQLWLLNPNGAIISPTGSVSAAGLLDQHARHPDLRFHGRTIMTSPSALRMRPSATGARIITDGGYAILAGRQVVNNGLIEANLGQVVLATGKSFTVDIVGDSLLAFMVTAPD